MYEKYIEEIIDMMFANSDFTHKRIVFSTRGREIGEEIYKLGGYRSLFAVMNILLETLQERDYHDYLGDLRELECCWSGICEEFQA